MAFVELKDVYKRYRPGEIVTAAADGVNFHMEKGEFVIIVGGAAPREKVAATPEEAAKIARGYMAEGMSPSEAAKTAAAECGLKKGEVYRLLVE